MNRDQARALIIQTFTHAFDKSRFGNFAINLLNRIDESKAQPWNNQYVKDAFKHHVRRYERLGTYTSPKNEKLDVLIVYLTAESTLERARTAIRNFVADHLKTRDEKDAALVAFVSPTEKQWRFSYVKMEYATVEKESGRVGVETRLTPARRFSYIVGEGESCRTAQTRFVDLLQNTEADPLLADIEEAFSVEAVTKEFYKEYERVFRTVEGDIEGISNPERKRLFTQRFLNRLMFIAFIQKKGWLKFGENPDYLNALWDDYERGKKRGHNFYRDRLNLLFFAGLSTPNEVNQIGINRGGFLKQLIGAVPYLNGGLFEQEDDDRDANIHIPDEALAAVLGELFSRFNFTVTESTPLDVEVAVDPEMLGKVFEELVTGRHETGSYYTPKPVVSFMCREALKGYLGSQLPTESQEAIERFVEEHNPDGLRNPEPVLEALRKVKACDPACGSGAYLLGMLHELLDLRECLFATRRLDAISSFERKLQIIQNNLYGVDLDEFAVNIARLRLWLSLAVEYEGDDPPPLPNLDFKIETGDSLTVPAPSSGLEQGFRKPLLDEYLKLKAEFLTAHHGHKIELRKRIAEIRATIHGWAHTGSAVDGFDWAVEFTEVFTDGGFDIVLANPPYVRMELFKPIKPILRKNFPDVHAERADLYCYFYARGLELLRQSGMLVFISSNKWLRANYGAKLREYIAKTCHVISITDFGDLPVFEGASAYPMIFVAHKSRGDDRPTMFVQVKSLRLPYPDVHAVLHEQGSLLPINAITGQSWRLADAASTGRVQKMASRGIPLGEYVGGQIYRGVVTGLNSAFVIDGAKRAELIGRCPESAKVIKPLIAGKDIKKWCVEYRDRWLIYMFHGIDTAKLAGVLEHLLPYKEQLEKRATKQKWYELQQPQANFRTAFEKPKIVYPQIMLAARFAYDYEGATINQKCFIVNSSDLYLLGILNSLPIWHVILEESPGLRGGYSEPRLELISALPIPDATATERAAITALAQKCLDAKGVGCEKWEAEINERVAALYGLTKRAIAIVEGSLAK